jgi:hypothetical protein
VCQPYGDTVSASADYIPGAKRTHPIGPMIGKFIAPLPVTIAIAKSFFRSGNPYNPPCPPLKKGGNYKELQEKSPFEKGGFRGI